LIVLVTRPREQAETLAEALRQRGHEPLLWPLLRIEPIADAGPSLERALEGAQALLFTSANGVHAFASASPRRDLKVLAVGAQTAAAAVAAGFAAIETADGDAAKLADLARARLKPAAGALLHAAGEVLAGDLAGTLETRGFEVRRVALYRALAADKVEAEVERALRDGRVGAALFYSPRTARIFVDLMEAAALAPALAKTGALALSPAVAAVLEPLPWARVETAAVPTEAAILAALDLVAAPGAVTDSRTSMSDPEIIPPSEPQQPRQPQSTPAPPTTPPDGGRRWSDDKRWTLAGLALALGFAIAALAGVSYVIWVAPPQTAAAPPAGDRTPRASEAEVQGLGSRIATLEQKSTQAVALETRLAALERSVGEASDSAGRAAQQAEALAGRVTALEQQLAKVGDDAAALAALQTATKSLETETQSLAQKLEAQSTALAALSAHAQQDASRSDAALLIALQQLRIALASSASYAPALHTAEALAQGRADLMQELQPLEAHAANGIPNLALLRERFEPMATRALEAAPGEPDQGWVASAGSAVLRFFDVRREKGGSETETAIGDAERALRAGDLAGAVAALQRLKGASGEAAASWIADAGARVEAEQRLAALDDAVRQLLSADAPGTKP
jgi:uroporphyrinogen-III synthase